MTSQLQNDFTLYTDRENVGKRYCRYIAVSERKTLSLTANIDKRLTERKYQETETSVRGKDTQAAMLLRMEKMGFNGVFLYLYTPL